jgi:hypothetical protein
MESKVSPNSIQERADKLAVVPEEKVTEAAPVEKPVESPVKEVIEKPVDSSIKTDTSKKPEVKPESKTEDKAEVKPIPNDPTELRKWNTKVSQENAALREEMKALRAAVEKTLKKPVDYKELAKNPEALQKQIELERAEAVEEMQKQLEEKSTIAVKNETIVERMKREQDAENYPEWKRVFPLIQNLAANSDGRVNFNKAPGDVLDDLYALATQLAPKAIVEPTPAPKVEVPPVPVKSDAEIAAEIAAAEQRGFEKAQKALRDEQAGAGIGSRGQGGKRSSGVTKDALKDMPLADLKKLISQE